jgi:hypothetical protein
MIVRVHQLARRIVPVLALLIGLFLRAGGLSAHQPGLSFLNLEAQPTGLMGRLDLSLRDVETAIGLDADNNGSVTYEELLNRQPAIGEYVLQRLRFRAGEGRLAWRVTGHKVAADQDGVYAVVELSVPWEKPPRRIEIACALFHDIDPNHRGLMQLTAQGEAQTAVFRWDEQTRTFDLSQPGKGEQFREFTWEGVWHIWIGYDHILFLVALLLPAVLRRKEGRWEGVEQFRPALVNVVQIVTAFTVAHSITLSLAALELINLPDKPVEATIALSVAVAAVNNLYPIFRGRAWLVAFCFGVIHGFGFASVLGDLELPTGALALTLFSFNVGVELGQLAIVAVFLPLAYALRNRPIYHQHLLRWGSVVIAVLACVWFVERVAGAEESYLDRLVKMLLG